MTNEEIVEKVRQHLRLQGCKALEAFTGAKEPFRWEKSWCTYMAEDGKRCAAGALLPADSARELAKNGGPLYFRSVWEHFEKAGFTDENFATIRACQIVHDEEEPRDWEAALEGERFQHYLDRADGDFYQLRLAREKSLL